MPDLSGLSRTRAERVLQDAHLLYRVEATGGASDRVVDQSPIAGARIPAYSEAWFGASCSALAASPVEGADVYDPCSGAAWLPHPVYSS